MTKLNEKQIAAYEARGAKRWTKGNFDRLYINANVYGCEFDYYGTGAIRSCHFNGERVSNAEGYRFKSSKVFIDVNTGELSVTTNTSYESEIREAVEAIMAEVEAETAEPEVIEDEAAEDAITETAAPVWGEAQAAIEAAYDAVRALASYGICDDSELGGKVDALLTELRGWKVGMDVLAEQGAAHIDRESVMAASERRGQEIEDAIANGGGTFVADEDEDALKMYRKGSEYPQDGTDAEYVRRVTYRTIGNGYLSEVIDIWQLAENVISAADLLLSDGASVYDVSEAIRSHIETTAVLYDVY